MLQILFGMDFGVLGCALEALLTSSSGCPRYSSSSDSFLFNRSKVFIVFSDRLGGNPCKLLPVSFVVRLILLAWTSRMCWHFGSAESRFFLRCCYSSLEGVTVCRLRAGKCTRFIVPSPCYSRACSELLSHVQEFHSLHRWAKICPFA